MSRFESALAVYDPAKERVHTFLVCDDQGVNRCPWSGLTFEELRANGSVSSGASVMSQDAAFALQEAAERRQHCTGPQRISAERFNELLNILPPQLWTRLDDSESFRNSEAVCGNLWTWVVRIGHRGGDFTRHYTICESGFIRHSELIWLCLESDSVASTAEAIAR